MTNKAEKRYHITKRGDSWALLKEGNQKASKIYGSKDAATANAQKFREKGSDLIIHKSDGSIEKWQKKK